MKCKYCKADDLPAHSRFCPWCGKKQEEDKTEIKVPPPQLLPSGTFFNRVTVKGERVSVSADTEAEYYAKARAVKLELIELKKNAPRMTVGAAIDQYISDNHEILSPSTIKGYKSYRKNHYKAVIDKDINNPINWQKAMNDECATIAPKTVANIWRLVTATYNAQGLQAPSINLPQIGKSNRPWLDYEQIQVFLRAVEGEECELPALLALHSLRRSELLALTADKIDLSREIITVSGASVYNDEGKFVNKDTNKTLPSQRTVHIVIPRLITLVEAADGLLVTASPNTPYVQINRVCRSVGLPEVGVHGLRHSFASLAYHLGWSEETTRQEGGWSDSKTVHEIYTHLAAQDANADIKRMREFYINGSKNANASEKVSV